jgi:hypothetical protein
MAALEGGTEDQDRGGRQMNMKNSTFFTKDSVVTSDGTILRFKYPQARDWNLLISQKTWDVALVELIEQIRGNDDRIELTKPIGKPGNVLVDGVIFLTFEVISC